MHEVTRSSGVTLTLPDGLAVADQAPAPAGRRRTRTGARREPVDAPPAENAELDSVVAALGDAGMIIVDEIPLGSTVARTPPGGHRRRGVAAPPEAGPAQIAVDLGAGESAAVLVEQDGVYSWHFPEIEEAARRGRRRRGETASAPTRRAVITLDIATTESRSQRRSRGFLSKLLLGPVKAIVLKFAAGVVIDKAISIQERGVHPGLVLMNGVDPAGWGRAERLAADDLPGDAPARILLWVHGTFSSSTGSFGALGDTDAGRALLSAANGHYDAVIGFDHPTLSVDPLANASDLLDRLPLADLPHPPVIDAVAFSRGALVLRSLTEHLLPVRHPEVTVGRAVFVGGTNGGTQLAEPANWKTLLDLYTNLGVAGARLVQFIPGAQMAGTILKEVISGLGDFARYLATEGLKKDGIPGLNAMSPKSGFVTELSRTQPGQPTPAGTEYFVVRSNFEPGSDTGDTLPERLSAGLRDGFVDSLMKGVPNDLVVDLASMVAIDALPKKPGAEPGSPFIDDKHDFGTSQTVFHTVYFAQEEVAGRIADWLDITPPVAANGGGTRARRPAGATRRTRASRSRNPRSGVGVSGSGAIDNLLESVDIEATTRARPPLRPDLMDVEDLAVPATPRRTRSRPTLGGARDGEGSSAAPPPTPAAKPPKTHVLAEMPERVELGATTSVQVRVSRKAMRAGAGHVSDAGSAADVDETRPLILQVIGKTNLEVVGDSRTEISVPAVGEPEVSLFFDVRPVELGAAELWVVARQGSIPLISLILTPTVVANVEGTALPTPVRARASAVDAPAGAGWDRMLQISEEERGNGRLYRFVLNVPELDVFEEFTSPLITGDRGAYVRSLYARIEDRWLSNRDDERAFLQELRSFGYELLEELVPEDLRAVLWTHRKELRGVMATCTEPFIPWELVHLASPRGRGLPRETAFLGQMGLVRWKYVGWPPLELRLRKGRARYIAPDYPDPRYALDEVAEERTFLEQTFGATAVKPDSSSVRTLLSRAGNFDLLHFAGHGEAEGDDIGAASILLQGRMEDGEYVPDRFAAGMVRANAKLAVKGSGPIVVLNACQAAREGHVLTTIGGFANAFLDAGAGVFISSLWAVGDQPARTFVEDLYSAMKDGLTLSEATARAREASREAGDATWLAYAVYGHPGARLTMV